MAVTADQVVVEIQAVIDQYVKATKQVADNTKRDMAAVEGAVKGATTAVEKSADTSAVAAEKGSRRRRKAASDTSAGEKVAANQSVVAAEISGAALERTAAKSESTARRRRKAAQEAAADETAAANQTSTAQQAAASGREMAGGGEESTGAKFVTAAAEQVPELVGKLLEGQDALHAFMQAGAQVAGVFGPWGAVIGTALGVLDRLWGASDINAESLKRFNDALGDSPDIAKAAEQGYDALIIKLSALSTVERRAFIAKLSQQILEGTDALKAGGATLAQSISSSWSDIAVAVVRNLGTAGEAARKAAQEIEDLKNKVASGDATPETFDLLADILRRLAGTAVPDAKAKLQDLANQLDIAGGNAKALADKTALLQAQQDAANGIFNDGNKALLDSAAAANAATGAVSGLAGEVANLGLQFSRLRELQNTASFIKGFVPLAAEGNPLANLPLSPTGFAPGDLPPSSAGKGGGGGGRGGGGRGGPARSTAAPGADTLSNQQSEIELNQKLLDGWYKGETALQEIRIAYEAVNAARAAGLKTATREYDDFVAQYQANKSANAALLTRLDLMKRGDELTKSVMSSGEKLTAQLHEYDKALAGNAISKETHKKLVDAATGANALYTDSIKAIGDAIQGGIQGAKSFEDGLLRVGQALAQMLLQAALFGNGPLGKLFGSLTGLTGGLLGIGFGGNSYDGGTGLGPIGPGGVAGHAAAGGQVLPGRLYEVGEVGREWFAPSVPGQVIPNHVIKNAAGGSGGTSGQPIVFNISMAGANGDRAIAEIAAAAVKKGLQSVPEINRQHRIRFA